MAMALCFSVACSGRRMRLESPGAHRFVATTTPRQHRSCPVVDRMLSWFKTILGGRNLGRGLTMRARVGRIDQTCKVQWGRNYDYASRPEARAGLCDACGP